MITIQKLMKVVIQKIIANQDLDLIFNKIKISVFEEN